MKTMYFGDWQVNVADHQEYFETAYEAEAQALIAAWRQAFPLEQSWVANTFGVPSLLIRLDCVVNGRLHLFEVEERPNGAGVAYTINQSFRQQFDRLRSQWPAFKVLSSPRRPLGDDGLWLDSLTWEQALAGNDLLLIRAEPWEREFHQLAERSVSTVLTEGLKAYGQRLGLWRRVTAEQFAELPWQSSFCLKPVQGSKCRDLEIWHPEWIKDKQRRVDGLSTKSRIQRTLTSAGSMYLQAFVEPMTSPVVCHQHKRSFMIYRNFFGYHPHTDSYVNLGGLWNARANLRVHGSGDTVMGPLLNRAAF